MTMTTTKHTPGPWSASPSPTSDGLYHVYKADGNFLTLEDAEHEANARLIAAAPDLLEALESLYHTANSIGEDTCDPVAFAGALEDARAAIRKAKGE